ncbi:MAG: chemotaxis protein CheW [Gammaproteobacteria bacterium]|nr:chemotaxis protein CheW [Gammaproteobacteria bacterium]
MSQAASSHEVRGVLLPLNHGQLLLPNVAVSEVIGYLPPEPSEADAPEWLLGVMAWRKHQIPVISFDAVIGGELGEVGHRARVAVCNTLNGNQQHPYIGILLTSIPRLIRVNEETIASPEEEQNELPMIKQQVVIAGQNAWIPDLDALEKALF